MGNTLENGYGIAASSKSGMQSKSANIPGTLFLVATPIGNLADWSYRAVETVRRAEVIACEDTRVTRVLLNHYGIPKKPVAFHEHNAHAQTPRLIALLRGGQSVALMSDAGTPLISDPGYPLVQAAIAEGIPLTSVPGASSVLTALSISGLPAAPFLFLGFAPPRSSARKTFLRPYAGVAATLLLFESPRRLRATLTDILEVFGDRRAAIARELTKRYEECLRGTLGELIALLDARQEIKGEIVILLAPPAEEKTEFDLDHLLRSLLEKETIRDAVAEAAALTGLPKKEVYMRALTLKSS